MLCTMFKIILLVDIIQQIKSYDINLYNVNMQANGPSNIRVSFRIRKEIEHLTGEFSLRHKTCHTGICTTYTYNQHSDFPFDEKKDQDKEISFDSSGLSPCKSYFGIKLRAEARNGVHDEVDTKWTAKWNPSICPDLTTTITTPPPTTTMTVESTSASPNSTSSPDSQFGSAAITGIVAGVLISLALLALTIFAVLLIKRGRNREEEMPADLNPDYGIYDDGPDYNVVTDENDYYDS